MYNTFISILIGISVSLPSGGSVELPPTIDAFDTNSSVEIMTIDYEVRGSEVYVTLDLLVHNSVVSVTSVSHNYVEAMDQLNEVIATVAE